MNTLHVIKNFVSFLAYGLTEIDAFRTGGIVSCPIVQAELEFIAEMEAIRASHDRILAKCEEMRAMTLQAHRLVINSKTQGKAFDSITDALQAIA